MLLAFLVLAVASCQDEPRFLPALAPDASITLGAAWEPCQRSKYNLFAETEVLRAPEPAEVQHTYGAAELAPFLPSSAVKVGDTWPVAAKAVVAFLRQFHPGARAELHHGYGSAPGTHACLRGASEERFEILFRAHAEFELEGGVTYTPAQFEGRLVLERPSGRVLALRIALPDRDSNVDVNVPDDSDYVLETGEVHHGMIAADIGWVPRMELWGGAVEPFDWPDEAHVISETEARARLARRFYAFSRLDWLPFDEAVRAARELDTPLHVVVLFGALDDESC